MAERKPAEAAALIDPLTRHQVFLQRLSAGEVKKFAPFLRQMDLEIRKLLSGEQLTEFARGRLEKLLKALDNLLAGILGTYTDQMVEDLLEIAQHEAEFSARALAKVVIDIETALPSEALLRAAILKNPLSATGPAGGKLLEPFIADWSASTRKAVTNAIRRGVFMGQTNALIVTAIRGTKARKYQDGLLNVTARQASAVVHTAVQHVSSMARQATIDEHEDIVKGAQWISTLDSRTCPTCRSLDLILFPVNKGPRPPRHINCRCTVVPLLAHEFEALNKGGTRASVGGSGGKQVDAGLTYYAWLKQQPAAFQDLAIGPVRGKLLREGGLSASRFAALQLDKQFEPLTLVEMKALEPIAFARAGIDP